jgi:hypothetical protein
MVKVPPIQDPDIGVMVYMAFCAVFVGLVNVPEMVPAPVALTPPVNPPVTFGVNQLNVVPTGIISLVVDEKVKELVLQIGAVVLFAMVGFGFTVTVTVKVPPSHPSADLGVTE